MRTGVDQGADFLPCLAPSGLILVGDLSRVTLSWSFGPQDGAKFGLSQGDRALAGRDSLRKSPTG
jgi:hypothetical protein